MKKSVKYANEANNNNLNSTTASERGAVEPKRASQFDKSSIMKQAWRIFRAAKAGAMKWAEAMRKAWQYAKEAATVAALDISFDLESMSVGEKRYPKSHMNYARVDGAHSLKRNLLKV